MPSFKTLKHSGLSRQRQVPAWRSGRSRSTWAARPRPSRSRREAPIIQSASGERSFVLEPTTYDNIPFVNGQRNYATLATFAPGMVGTQPPGQQRPEHIHDGRRA